MGFVYAYIENGMVMKITLINWSILNIWHMVEIQHAVVELCESANPPYW